MEPVFQIKTREGTFKVFPKGNLCMRAIETQSSDQCSCALFKWIDNFSEEDSKRSDMKDVLEVKESLCSFCIKTGHVSKNR